MPCISSLAVTYDEPESVGCNFFTAPDDIDTLRNGGTSRFNDKRRLLNKSLPMAFVRTFQRRVSIVIL